jgi:hypothetical protein
VPKEVLFVAKFPHLVAPTRADASTFPGLRNPYKRWLHLTRPVFQPLRTEHGRLALSATAAFVALMVAPIAAWGQSAALTAAMANPCSLITLDEAQALLGNLPMQPTTSFSGVAPRCNYKDANGNHSIDVAIYTDTVSGVSDTLSAADPYNGLGAEAYCNPRDGRANLIVAIDAGDTLQVIEQQSDMTCDQAAQFAQTALGRLTSGSLAPAAATPPPVSGDLLTNAMAYPCSIVTVDEAGAIFGTAIQTTQPPGTPNPFCSWHGSGFGSVSINATIYMGDVASGEAAIAPTTPVSGLGAEAVCNPNDGSANLVVAIDANHFLAIAAQGQANVTCDQEQQFAQKALTRL